MRAGQRTLGIGLVMLAMALVFVGQRAAAALPTWPASTTNVYAWRFFSQDWITMSAPTSEGSYHWRLTDNGWENIPYELTSMAPDWSFYRWSGNDIERSLDCGDTWTVVGNCSLAGKWGLSPSPVTGTLFINASDGVYKTTDGYNWHRVYTQSLHSFVFSPDFGNDGIAYAEYGYFQDLYQTHDWGENWEYLDIYSYTGTMALSNAGGIPAWTEVHFSPQFAEDQTIFVMTQSRLYRSVDGGEAWEMIVDSHMDFPGDGTSANYITGISVSPSFGEDQALLLGLYEVVPYLSRDRGETWEPLKLPLNCYGDSHTRRVGLRYAWSFPECPSISPVTLPGPYRLYLPLVAVGGRTFDMWVYTDGALCAGESEYEPGHLYRSQDGGETWEEIIIFEALTNRLYLPLIRRGY